MSINYPRITRLLYDQDEQPYAFLWLKYVEGVDLGQHCQKCLLGPTSKRVGTRWIKRGTCEFKNVPLNESPANIYYLCGVTEPYVWERNFHLVFRYKKGGFVEKKWVGLEVEIRDAEAIEIRADAIDQKFKPTTCTRHHYMTCRNVQFAWAYSRGLYLPVKRSVTGHTFLPTKPLAASQKKLF
jgi:hypothetical protein